MKRLTSIMLAIAVGVGLSASSLVAQDPPRQLTPPLRGEAEVEIMASTVPKGNEVVSTIRVRNISKGAIAGFKVEENWYKGNDAVGGDVYRHPRPLKPGEAIEFTLTSPRSAIVGARNQFQFSHANGTIKPKQVKSIDIPKPAATDKPAAKPPAKPPVG